MKILIADSGSTKTDWCLLDLTRAEYDQVGLRVTTGGINPFQQSEEEIAQQVRAQVIPLLQDCSPDEQHTSILPQSQDGLPDELHFYGAGCTPEKVPLVSHALAKGISNEQAESALPAISVHSDMLAAARALCGRRPGIACILGTGSNSCYYDGHDIRHNVPALGFILGDEGSGAVLGRLLVGDLLKDQLTPGLREAFLEDYGLTMADIIERVYRRPFANRFLASFAPFLARYRTDEGIHRLLLSAFNAFLVRNVKHYDWQHLPVHFTGSIAWHFQSELHEAATTLGMQVGQVVQSPMEGLIRYHAGLS